MKMRSVVWPRIVLGPRDTEAGEDAACGRDVCFDQGLLDDDGDGETSIILDGGSLNSGGGDVAPSLFDFFNHLPKS